MPPGLQILRFGMARLLAGTTAVFIFLRAPLLLCQRWSLWRWKRERDKRDAESSVGGIELHAAPAGPSPSTDIYYEEF